MALENMSLDEYIRRKKKGETVSLLDMRKKQKEVINQDELDEDLEDIMIRNSLKAQGKTTAGNVLSKFERIRISEDRNGDNDDDDIDMENPSIRFAKEINKMPHPECCNAKPFFTIENKQKVKITSQQWRLKKDGNQSNGIRSGRVEKNRRQNDTKFVNRGGFTKVVNGDGENLGIIRNQRRNDNNYHRNNNNQSQVPPIQINMNWRGFLDGYEKLFQSLTSPSTPARPIPNISIPMSSTTANENDAVNVNMKIAGNDLLEFLLQKKAQNQPKVKMPYADAYARDAGIDFMKTDRDDENYLLGDD